MEEAFARSSSEVLRYFNVTLNQGLSQQQVKENLKKYGPNGK